MKSEPIMKSLVKRVGPFTAKTKNDRLAALVDAIIGQQISTATAAAIKTRLKSALELAPKGKYSAAALLQHTPASLKTVGVSNQKAGYLLDLAAKVQSKEVELQRLGRKNDQDVIDTLTQVKGIGVWTAQMFLIFSLGRLDVLPVDDLGIKNAIQKFYELDERPTANEIEQLAGPWRPYASMASWYLWQGLAVE